MAGEQPVRLKRVLYALRPAVCLVWMRQHEGTPPMRLQDLLAETELPKDLVEATVELVERKAVTRELGEGRVPPAVARFVAEVLETDADAEADAPRGAPLEARRSEAAARFVVMAERFAPAMWT